MSIAVDFDATLSFHADGMQSLGKPIVKMLKRVKGWIDQGQDVVIFTARASNAKQIGLIQDWLETHGLPRLRVTNIKEPSFHVMYDDRAVGVIPNRGIIIRVGEQGGKRRVRVTRK